MSNVDYLVTERFKIYDPPFQNIRPCLPKIKVKISVILKGHKDDQRRSEGHHDRVSTWRLMAVVGVSSKNDTTWSATQVGLRPVESGLGGHEEGVFGVDEGVEKTSLPL